MGTVGASGRTVANSTARPTGVSREQRQQNEFAALVHPQRGHPDGEGFEPAVRAPPQFVLGEQQTPTGIDPDRCRRRQHEQVESGQVDRLESGWAADTRPSIEYEGSIPCDFSRREGERLPFERPHRQVQVPVEIRDRHLRHGQVQAPQPPVIP